MKKLSLAAIAGALAAGGLVALGQTNAVAQADDAALLAALIAEGEPLYNQNCAVCHLADGAGATGPRLAVGPAGPNPFLNSGTAVAFQIINGYMDHGMPPFGHLSNREVAAIATYVRNSWGNTFGVTTEATAAAARAEAAGGGGE
jgi:mono/diheme cytochrome c family protein